MKIAVGLFLGLAALALWAPFADGHFKLIEPKSWIVENGVGDPQKLGPCGGTSENAGTPTNAITSVQGGQKLHIKVQEMVYHPGHYRIALAVNSRSELPDDPVAVTRDTERGPFSVSAKIESAPKVPVLVDGLWPHTSRSTEPFETDVQLPNISCPACTLQIVEFMAQHPYNKDGGYTYHHCAVLNISADPSKPIDTRWPVAKPVAK
jgi:hypothetical protein